ncbi:MAG TPA: hypothetical protein DCM62_03200 [Bacteroidales bacterium]|nr:hypothetical protein [Bacteroidales bacterium]
MKTLFFLTLLLTSHFAMTQSLINPRDAVRMVNQRGVVIVDCNPVSDFARTHITNAVNLWHEDLYRPTGVDGILRSNEELARILGSKGIAHNSIILLYDAGHQRFAGRIYWILRYLGATDVRIINGGMGEWQRNRLPVSRTPRRIVPATFQVTANAAIFADMARVRRAATTPNMLLLDVRDAGEFRGTEGGAVRKGHIPGSINLPHQSVLNANGTLKSREELQQLFTAAGVTPNREIIVYCAASVRAGIVYFALRSILNYPNVRLYDGGFNEWEADAANPVRR